MRWSSTPKIHKRYGWHRWFAWHPIKVNDQRVWLETVERKATDYAAADTFVREWEYHLLEYTPG